MCTPPLLALHAQNVELIAHMMWDVERLRAHSPHDLGHPVTSIMQVKLGDGNFPKKIPKEGHLSKF